MATKIKKDKLPYWAEPLLQGITFWVGYKKQLYPHYPLTEGAIVSEATNLIHSNLADDEILVCEKMYKDIAINGVGQTRADLVFLNKTSKAVKYIIEVKRSSASNTLINKDISRLGTAKQSINNARCFLLVVSQSSLPEIFVNEETGKAKTTELPDDNFKPAKAFVRRVCKATGSFDKKNKAHFACLIEVF